VHGRPGYRCRHGQSSAQPRSPGRLKPLYLREDQILARVVGQLNELDHHEETADAARVDDPAALAEFLQSRPIVVMCDGSACTVTDCHKTCG
jgi:site-specific DNA recombinase